jgi:hypothetical protein
LKTAGEVHRRLRPHDTSFWMDLYELDKHEP